MTASPTAVLRLSCPDQKGLVAAVSDFVYHHGGNIVHADQHTDVEEGIFLQRVEFETTGIDLERAAIAAVFAPVAERFGLTWTIDFSDRRRRLAILVSRQGHCLLDLLGRWKLDELPVETPVIVSNHADHADAAAAFGLAFHHLPLAPGADDAAKAEQERALLDLLAAERIDLVVLARYMQILGPAFVQQYRHAAINIHHSFLPAFAGARPYHKAHERGVKIIGATAHYVTEDLDQGPIIEQDVVRVSHRDAVDDMVHKGKDLEKVVLARAVHLHLENRVLVYGNKTVVFN